jgi:DNA processing protein
VNRLLLGLVCTPSVGWKTIRRLVGEGVDRNWIGRSVREWETSFPFLRKIQMQQLCTSLTEERIQTIEQQLTKSNIGYVNVFDQDYPGLLKEIFDPPWVLFYKGNIGLLASAPPISIVGSRKTTVYGRKVTERFAAQLVEDGWVVVSGMAIGIDTVAHQQALAAGGLTVAVLGSGLNRVYPPQNKSLFEKITATGVVLSEYPPDANPHPSFFPQRNRIIAGLSYGTLVVEASEKSGSLITAYLALEQGREVFAVPGSIFDMQSVGTNRLIQQHGAKLVLHPSDLYEELRDVVPQDWQASGLNETKIVEDNEKIVLNLLQQGKMHLNELIHRSAMSTSELSRALVSLQIKGYVSALPGSYYQRMEFVPKR